MTNDKAHILSLVVAAKTSRISTTAINTALDKLTTANALQCEAARRLNALIYLNANKHQLLDRFSNQHRQQLTQSLHSSVADNLAKTQTIQKLAALLETTKTPFILLKSSAFNGLIYLNEYPRFGVDLDILIKKKDLATVEDALSIFMQRALANKKGRFDGLYENSYIPNSGIGPSVDLHFGLTYPKLFNIDEGKLWETSIQHPSHNNPMVRTLSPEDMLVHLATHALKDLNFYAYNLLDVHEIICQLKPDIEKTTQKAKQSGASVALYFLLTICLINLDTPIEKTAIDKNKPSKIKERLAWLLLNHINTIKSADKSLTYRFKQVATQVLVSDSLLSTFNHQTSYFFSRNEHAE